MQTNHQDIYSMLGAEKGDEQMYKDIGSFIFKETALMIKNPTSLILKLKGVGSWHLRKKRMEIVVNEWTDRSLAKPREEFGSEASYQEHIEKHLRYVNFQERLKEYEQYLSIKKEIRAKRYETQVLLQPSQEENGRFKSS
jgi:hypothetical protein